MVPFGEPIDTEVNIKEKFEKLQTSKVSTRWCRYSDGT